MQRTRGTKGLFAGAALLVTLGVCGAALAQGEADMKLAFKKGEKWIYKMTATGQVMGVDFTLAAETHEEVKEVKENGHIVLVRTDQAGKVTVMGMEMDTPASNPVTMTLDAKGRLIDYMKEPEMVQLLTPEVERASVAASNPILPTKAVKRGETWRTEMDNPAFPQQKINVESQYHGRDKVGEVDCWKITQKTSIPLDGNGDRFGLDATMWLDPASGRVMKDESSVEEIPTQFGRMSWKQTSMTQKG